MIVVRRITHINHLCSQLESLKRQLADASARADRLESENKRLRDQVEKAKRLAAELAQL